MKKALLFIMVLVIAASGSCLAGIREAQETFISMKPLDIKLHAEGDEDIYALLEREIPGDFSISFDLKILQGAVEILLLPSRDSEESSYSFWMDEWYSLSCSRKGISQKKAGNYWILLSSTHRITLSRKGSSFTIEAYDYSNGDRSTCEVMSDPEPLKAGWVALAGRREKYHHSGGKQVSFYLNDLVVSELPSEKVLFSDNFNNGMSGAWKIKEGRWARDKVDGLDYLTSAEIQNYMSLARLIVSSGTIRELEELAAKCVSNEAKTFLFYAAAKGEMEKGRLNIAENLAMKIQNPLEKSSALALIAKSCIEQGDKKAARISLEEISRTVASCSNGAQRSYWLTQGGDLYSVLDLKRAADFYERAVREGNEYAKNTPGHRFMGGRAFLDEIISSKWDARDVPLLLLLLIDHRTGKSLIEKNPFYLPPWKFKYVLENMKGDLYEKAELLKFILENNYKTGARIGDYTLYDFLRIDRKLVILSTGLMESGVLKDECLVSIVEFILPDEIGKAQEMIGMISSTDRKDECRAKIAGIYGRKDYSRGIAYARAHIAGYRMRSLTLNYIIMRVAKEDPGKALELARDIPDPLIKSYTIREIQKPGKESD